MVDARFESQNDAAFFKLSYALENGGRRKADPSCDVRIRNAGIFLNNAHDLLVNYVNHSVKASNNRIINGQCVVNKNFSLRAENMKQYGQ